MNIFVFNIKYPNSLKLKRAIHAMKKKQQAELATIIALTPKPIYVLVSYSLSLAFGRFYTLLAAAASIETSSRDESFSQHDTIDGRGRKKGLLIKPS